VEATLQPSSLSHPRQVFLSASSTATIEESAANAVCAIQKIVQHPTEWNLLNFQELIATLVPVCYSL